MTPEQTPQEGWWVPVTHFWRQNLLPHTGTVQTVGDAYGRIHKALFLSGFDVWCDANYKPIHNVTDWLKPSRYFSSRDDMQGDREALARARSEASTGSILRSEP